MNKGLAFAINYLITILAKKMCKELKCCLDKCPLDICLLLKMIKKSYPKGIDQNQLTNGQDIADI